MHEMEGRKPRFGAVDLPRSRAGTGRMKALQLGQVKHPSKVKPRENLILQPNARHA